MNTALSKRALIFLPPAFMSTSTPLREALSGDDHVERTGLNAAGRVARRAGMDRAERVANPVFGMNYEGFKAIVLKGAEPNAALAPAARPAWVRALPGPLNDGAFPGDDETILKYWLEALFHGDQHMLVKEWSNRYGGGAGNYVTPAPIFGWGHTPAVSYFLVICDPEDHQRLARDHVKKAPVYDGASYGQSFLGHYDVVEWRQQRNHLMAPMMPMTMFATMLPDFEHAARELVARFRAKEGATMFYGSDRPEVAFNVHELLLDTTFRVLCRTLLGESDDFIFAHSQKIRWALQNPEVQNVAARKIIKSWCQAVYDRAVARRDADVASGKDGDAVFASVGPLMREMLEVPAMYQCELPGQRGAHRQVLDNIGILSLAGHDTTGGTLTFCLMELAAHPEWQEKARAEARAVFAEVAARQARGEGDGGLVYADFNKLETLTKCLNETLRLWNAVPYGSQRELEHDEVIAGPTPGSQVRVPKGTMFLVPNYCQGRSKALWGEDAEEWKPERWGGFAEPDSLNFSNYAPRQPPPAVAPHVTASRASASSSSSSSSSSRKGVAPAKTSATEAPAAAAAAGCPFASPAAKGAAAEATGSPAMPHFTARNPESPRFHPFTRGPRDCYGKNFAQAEIRVVLAHLLHNFSFDLAEPSRSQYLQNPEQLAFQQAGVLKHRDGMWMHVTPVEVAAKL